MAVLGSVNGVEFRSSLMPQGGGTHILVVREELRDTAGVDVGGILRASGPLVTEPLVVEVPDELRRVCKHAIDCLTPTRIVCRLRRCRLSES